MFVLTSLRARLLALVLVAVAPAFAILAIAARDSRRLIRAEVEDETHALSLVVAERSQRSVDRARGLVTALAQLPSMQRQDGPTCSREAARILADSPDFGNLGGVSLDGRLFCSAQPPRAPVNVSDRRFFRGALESGGFAAGRVIRSRVTGAVVVGFGLPIRDEAGAVQGVAFASVDARVIQRELDALPMPPGAAAVVVDAGGAVIAARPGGASLIGTQVAEPLLGPLEAHGGARVLDALDGTRRIWSFHEVTVVPGVVALRVAAGVPEADANAASGQILAKALARLAVAAVLTLLAAGIVGELTLVRRLRALVGASRRIAAGDYSARSGAVAGRDEVGELARSFDEMARSLDALTRQNRLILDAVDEGIVGLDREGRVMFTNPAAARALGWSPDELLGRDAHALFHARRADGSELPRDACAIQAAMREGRTRQETGDVFVRRDGTSFPVEYVASPVADAGRLVGLVLAFRDVTERRRLEDQLRQAQKMEAIGQLAGGVAHDFNNLLTAIVSFAHLVEDALPAGHESRGDVAEILAAAGRASALTRQLLAFSRRQRLAPRAVDLAEVVRGMEAMLRRVLGEAVALEVDVRAPGTVIADPGQLELAVLNLAVNARDAMPGGGRLVVAVDELLLPDGPDAGGGLPDGPLALLSVRDFGVGMDDATRTRVFEPFFTTKPAGQGTGLGLSTVYGIVAQSGGAVRVRSAPGRGSEFRIYLPLRAGTAAEGPAPAPPARPAGGREVVLLVEDDGAIRAVAERTLARAGYRVLAAASADQALAAARAHPGVIDLLVSDVVLPGRNGWELARELCAERAGLRLLFMSGYAAGASGESLLPEGLPLVPKPFAPDDLLAAVRAAIDAGRGDAPGAALARSG